MIVWPGDEKAASFIGMAEPLYNREIRRIHYVNTIRRKDGKDNGKP